MNANQILIALSESERTRFGKTDFVTQSFPQKVFSALWSLQSEVCNGGFRLYFTNCSSETAGFVVEALDAVGARKTAEICKRAIAVAFPSGLPASPDAISADAEKRWDELGEALSEVDDEFFDHPDDLTAQLFAFVSKHPDEFGVQPKPDDA